MPSADQGGVGHDHLAAVADTGNAPSIRVLEKAGFQKIGVRENDFENSMGLRSSVLYRLARPGKSLHDLGLDTMAEESQAGEIPQPPVS